jgi:hypothetical protein
VVVSCCGGWHWLALVGTGWRLLAVGGTEEHTTSCGFLLRAVANSNAKTESKDSVCSQPVYVLCQSFVKLFLPC